MGRIFIELHRIPGDQGGLLAVVVVVIVHVAISGIRHSDDLMIIYDIVAAIVARLPQIGRKILNSRFRNEPYIRTIYILCWLSSDQRICCHILPFICINAFVVIDLRQILGHHAMKTNRNTFDCQTNSNT